MDIFEFAMDKEKFSEDYYRELAEKTNNPGLKNICTMLAEEEAKHYHIVRKMQNEAVDHITDIHVLGNSQKIFESMRQSTEKFDLDVSEL
jgi:rubrerythrin